MFRATLLLVLILLAVGCAHTPDGDVTGPDAAKAEPGKTAAADPNGDVQWFKNVLQTNNGHSFCVPARTRLVDVAISVKRYMQVHQIPDAITTPTAIQILAHLYPCSTPAGGRRVVTVPRAGVYATIDTRETISVMRLLAATKEHENDAIVETVEKHADHFQPPVFFSLATLLYRQGNLDGAIFWFNAGRLRADYDAARCADISARSAVSALVAHVPAELRRAQFVDLPKLKKIIDDVIKWDEATPHDYDQRWINLHGLDAMTASLGNNAQPSQPLSVPQEQWAALAQKTRDDYRRSAEKAINELAKRQHK